MLARFRPRLSFANVTSLLALLVALGGTAYAAATIGPAQIKNDAVRSRHVKDGAVRNPDLGANSVATGKVANGSLLRQDFRAGQIPPPVPPTEPVRLVKPAPGFGPDNCSEAGGSKTGEFCQVFNESLSMHVDWSNYARGYQVAGFYKDRSGIVHLQGSIEGNHAGPAFVLPPGYRPTGGHRWFAVWNSHPDSSTPLGGVDILTNGVVHPRLPGGSSYLSLDGIQFRP